MKNKKSKMIVFLCVALIFMGVGYAVLQSNLNISGTAKAVGTFNVQITNAEEDATSSAVGGVPAAKKSASHTQTTATINAEFSKPGDFVEYEIEVSNLGSIDAIIDVVIDDEILASEEDEYGNKIYLLSVTPSARQELLVEQVKTLLVKIEYNKNAQGLPESESVTFTVSVNATQKGTQTVEPLPVPESIWTIEEIEEVNGTKYGRIIGYNEQSGGTDVVIPYSVDGTVVKELDGGAFTSGEIEVYFDGDELFVAVINAEGERYNTISTLISNMGISSIYSSIDDVPSGYTKLGYYNYDDENGDLLEPTCNITSVDMSQATGLVEIGSMAFYNAQLTSVNFGQNSSLETIGMGAFASNQLTTISLPDSLEAIEEGAFYGNQITGTLIIPSSVTSIGESAFSSNQISGTVTIPSSVTSIGNSAFSSNQISTLNLSNATSLQTIGESAFRDNQLSGTLIIPANITTIESSAFSGESDGSTNQLVGLNLSNATNLEVIESSVFRCNNLSGTLVIPANVTTIGTDAFSENNLNGLDLSTATSLDTIGDYSFEFNQISGTLTIPSSVTSIGLQSFYSNKIEILNLGSGLTSLGTESFEHNIDSTIGQYTLTTINIDMTEATWKSRDLPTYDWYDGSPTITYNS